MSQASTAATLLASTGSIAGGGAGIGGVTKSINDASILERQEGVYGMPESYRTLDKDQDFTADKYKNKYGGFYGKYLIGVHSQSKDSGNNIDNTKWGEGAFDKYQLAKTAQGEFAKVTKATGEDGFSLQSVCKKAYEQSKLTGDYEKNAFQYIVSKSNEGVIPEHHYPEDDIWKFCSVIGIKPKTLEEAGEKYPDNTNGGPTGDRKIFIAIDDPANAQFWNHQHKTLKDNIPSSDTFFYNGKDKKSIKEICREAYFLPVGSSGNTQNLSAEISKYCQMVNAVLHTGK